MTHHQPSPAGALSGLLQTAASLDVRMPTGPNSTVMTNLLLDAADRWTRDALAAARHDLRSRPLRRSAIATTDSSV